MWALRRASNPLQFRGLRVVAARALCANSYIIPGCLEGTAICSQPFQAVFERCEFYHSGNACSEFMVWRRGLSSQAGAESSESEDDLEDGFSELETPAGSAEKGNEDELISEPELSGLEDNDTDESPQNALHSLDTETDADERKKGGKRFTSELFKAIMAAPSIHAALEKWVEEGKELDREEIFGASQTLRRRQMYTRALQLSEWLEANKKLEFTERDYASRLDLISKVRGLQKAESYIVNIPKSFRGEVLYRTLLANCVAANNLRKAEEVFNKMKDMGFSVTTFACNQLLLLYKRLDKKKIADVLLLMEKENIKPSLLTYKLLIDTKGQSNDITGMEQIVEAMKAEGIEPDIKTQAILAKHYAASGLDEKAEGILREMEGENIKNHRWVCEDLLPLYAELGKADEVGRIWKVCEPNPRYEEYIAVIEAWGKLKKIDEAEVAFDKMASTYKKLSSRQYSVLLKVYANHKMLSKGKNLVKRMAENGIQIGPLTWDALVKLYVDAGEVEKADSMLHKAVQQNQLKPMFSSYMAIMDQYAKRGDVHNAEKVFFRMKQSGYSARARQFHALLQTYINAKAPAYGIRERMKADNVFPNKSMTAQLAQVDAFRRTAVSDLLE